MNTMGWSSHKARVAADFGAAAASYDRAARLQQAVIAALAARLPDPGPNGCETLLDLGCGTGAALPALSGHFPTASIVSLDIAEGMAQFARSRHAGRHGGPGHWLVGDAEALPLASSSLDLVFSSLAIQWCENTAVLFAELARVLKPEGRLLLSTLVDGTLSELREAWAEADPGRPHVNRFLTADALSAEVGRIFPEARVEIVPIRLPYTDTLELLRELKGLGARYKDDPRRSGATGPGRMRRLQQAYRRFAAADGSFPATYQVAIIRL